MFVLVAHAWLLLTVLSGTLLLLVVLLQRTVGVARRLRRTPAPRRAPRFAQVASSRS